ncbi:MAG: isocitrate/isopropylmalate dehydrogenase family protein [Clostridia bacterium]|nr:isocitrate/isopropylmalate dehydrogenase family protein [Clostridia bacterium]
MADHAALLSQFEKLLNAQAERAQRLSEAVPFDFTQRPLTIGLIPGDGIGPIIMKSAQAVLNTLLEKEISSGEITLRPIEGLTIENRLARNESIPSDVLAEIKQCPVLLKGPTTTPTGGTMTSANVTLRKELDLFSNVRPVRVESEGIDWTFFRENTEGEYTLGSSGIEIDGLMTMDFKVTTVAGTRRIAKAAYDFARATGRTHVAIVTKANIMKKTDGLFSKICHEVASEYPEITTEEYFVDIMSANLVNPQIRSKFQVILAPNLYGDILTDEAAQIQGGVGTAGSANTGSRYAMFEAIHGSAPRMLEEGLGDYASPESILQAAAMMLDHIGCVGHAEKLRSAINRVKSDGIIVDGTRSGATCAAFSDALLEELKR